MSSLLYLSSDDFNIEKGTKGNILCNNIQGFSLVLFFSNSCAYCKDYNATFKRLPGTLPGCQFGLLNISTNMECYAKSQQTITPLKVVPYIVLYVDGKPYVRYTGSPSDREIQKFIIDMSNQIQGGKQFVNNKNPNITKESNGMMVYGGYGKAYQGDKNLQVCYLEYELAYNKQLKK
jgi:hypothetical protein